MKNPKVLHVLGEPDIYALAECSACELRLWLTKDQFTGRVPIHCIDCKSHGTYDLREDDDDCEPTTEYQLKPCPFCGSQAKQERHSWGVIVGCASPNCRVRPTCSTGGLVGRKDWERIAAETIDGWNARTADE